MILQNIDHLLCAQIRHQSMSEDSERGSPLKAQALAAAGKSKQQPPQGILHNLNERLLGNNYNVWPTTNDGYFS